MLVFDSDLATFLGRPTIAGSTQAVLACNLASGVVLDYLNVPSLTTMVVENLYLDGPSGFSSTIVVPGYPVTAVTEVQELILFPGQDPQWNTLVEGVNYTWSKTGVISKYGSNDATDGQKISGTVMGTYPGQSWTTLQQGIQISYTYGSLQVPYTVQAITLALAARLFVNPTGLQRESIGGYEYQYNTRNITSLAALAPDEIAILGRYSDVNVG